MILSLYFLSYLLFTFLIFCNHEIMASTKTTNFAGTRKQISSKSLLSNLTSTTSKAKRTIEM